ncbi:hypothetical protein HDU79_007162 [Rhizoclosmatium sp. JEL0117]|nr:hypothetical protein HDU79_007162 [Rhizoclosmatium sp. JEL0117]
MRLVCLILTTVALLVSLASPAVAESPSKRDFTSLNLPWVVPVSGSDGSVASAAALANTNRIASDAATGTTSTTTSNQKAQQFVPVPSGVANPFDAAVGAAKSTASQSITASGSVFAAVAIISGLVLVFFGHQLFRPILFLSGFYLFSAITFVVLQNIEFSTKTLIGGDWRDWVYLLICVAVGAIGGGLVLCFWKLGFWIVGACLGFATAMVLLTSFNALITSQVARWTIVCIFTLAGAVLVYWFELPVLIAGTSVAGSFAVFLGIDVFVRTRFYSIVVGIVNGLGISAAAADSGSGWIGMVAGAVVLALIGIAWQFHQVRRANWTHRGLFHRNQLRDQYYQVQYQRAGPVPVMQTRGNYDRI